MTGIRRLASAAIAFVIIAAPVPRTVRAQAPATLVVAQSVAVTALDPAGPTMFQTSPAGDEAALLIYDGLFRFTEDMTIGPALATSWRVAADGRTWTLKVRQGVTFQDGTALTTQAVVADLQREVNPSTNPSNRTLWDPIASVSAPDTRTVQIVTKEPYGALLNTLAHSSGLLSSPQAAEKWGGQYQLHPAGTGPYQVDRWDVGAQLELVRNPRYWGGRPGFDRIILRNVPDASTRLAMIQSGQAQVADAIPARAVDDLRRVSGVTVTIKPALRTVGMGINLNRPILQDIRVRQALNYAVNKELIVKALFGGNGTVLRSPVALQTPGYVEVGPWPYDPPTARKLLQEAGWTPGPPIGVRVKGGESLQLVLLTPQGVFPRDVEVVETLADYLRNVGFEPHFLYVDAAGLRDHLRRPPDQYTWDLALFGFCPSNGEAGAHLDALYRSNPDRQHPPHEWNATWYSHPGVDRRLADARRALDSQIRATAYADVQRQVWKDAPYLWLYAEDVIVATRGVSGVEILPIAVTVLRSAHR